MTLRMMSKYSYIFEEAIQLVEIYQSSKSIISEYIIYLFEDKELDEAVVVRKFRTTTQHGAVEGKMQVLND